MNNGGRTRIAPTPSGFLHAGNAINFLLTDRIAKELGLKMLLRIDDLDTARVRPEYVRDVFDSLQWLGIEWQEGPRDPRDHQEHWSQELRLARYNELLERLRELGVLYACTCTRSQLREGSGNYGGSCRDKGIDLDDPRAVWRITVPEGQQVRMMRLSGEAVDLDIPFLIGDVVLRQRALKDVQAMPAYQLASLADDVDRQVTLIVRGEDLLPSTAMQLYLAQLLELRSFTETKFLHHPLLLDAEGNKLSKSAGAFSLKMMRERGEGPEELIRQADQLYKKLIG